jgi:hypothetical protein
LRVVRTYQDPACTTGELICNGQFVAHTLERPWKFLPEEHQFDCRQRLPEEEIRCLKEGRYRIFLHYKEPDKQHKTLGREIYWRFELNWFDTAPHCAVQIHIGNTLKNTTGCIVPGFEIFNSKQRIDDSGDAILKLEEVFYGTRSPVNTPDKQIDLTISSLPTPTKYIIRDDRGETTLLQDGLKWILNNGEGKVFHMFNEHSRTFKHIIFRGAPNTWARNSYVRYGLHGGIIEHSPDKNDWAVFDEGAIVRREDEVMKFLNPIL